MNEVPERLLIRELPAEVDVVVIGAGSAGCVVASRLSEEPGRQVLLVEAGEVHATEQSRVPGSAFFALGPDTLYMTETVPQPALGNRPVPLPTGRGLGGSSTINLLAWFHGDPADYDGWADDGATGWDWESVRPVFRGIEHFALGADEQHGAGGPMVIDTPRDLEPALIRLLAAGERAGLPVSGDLNGTQRTGIGLVQQNIRDGRRHSVVDGYLRPASDRGNLRVALGRRADRVVISHGRAVGVELNGGHVVRARETVVVAAGALRSPQLLMLSGIGAADHLRAHGIDVVADSPGVGANMQDHPYAPMVWQVLSGRTLLDAEDELSLASYRLARRGPLSTLATVGTMIPPGSGAAGPAEVQALFYLIGIGPGMAPMPEPAITATVALLTPESRGSLRLASADPGAAPLIDPAYLTSPRDLPRLRAGIETVRAMMRSSDVVGVIGKSIFPDGSATGTELDEWVRANLQTQWHPAGTVRMGSDDLAPADERLAVRGVSNLVVADASVMPRLPRGNTQAATIMIAERAARFLTGGE